MRASSPRAPLAAGNEEAGAAHEGGIGVKEGEGGAAEASDLASLDAKEVLLQPERREDWARGESGNKSEAGRAWKENTE